MAQKIEVALFTTCLVDLFRPNVGFAAIELLQLAGCEVVVPKLQTCCGQPTYNSGSKQDTRNIAKQTIANFENYQAVVVPSGSCAGMMIKHYPDLFEPDGDWHRRATAFASKTFELMSFLAEHLPPGLLDQQYSGTACYHDSCAGLRELNIKHQPRQLLKSIRGLQMTALKNDEVCCGFGGLFCVKYSDVSNKMVGDKIEAIHNSGADTLLAGDLGCLLNIAGKLSRERSPVKVWHTAEVLAGRATGAAIGQDLNQKHSS